MIFETSDPVGESAIDPVARDAVAPARAALATEVGEHLIGDHLGVETEAPGVVTHYFATTQKGYQGWRWAVVIAHAPGAAEVTLDEVVLLPGDDAIVAPSWVPYRERLRPGDLSPGDLLPADEDDPRLVPGYLEGEEFNNPAAEAALAAEIGLGRTRVLSVEGRDAAAQRWYTGESGPEVALSQSAPGRCGTCGFLVWLAGPLSSMFGVCANEFANDDAQVVSLDHGCGAHSGAQLRRKQLPPPLPDPFLDTISRDDLVEF